MIDPTEVRLIVAHHNGPANACPDGTSAALLAHDACPDARVLFVNHEEVKDLKPEPGIVFLDIAPTLLHAPAFAEAGAWCLDHHEKQRANVEAFGERGVYADEPGVSGAMLAFRHLWLPPREGWPAVAKENAKHFAALAGVRDTWRRGDSRWYAASAQAEALRFYPWERLMLYRDPFGESWRDLETLLEVGYVLVEQRRRRTKADADRCLVREVRGLRVAMVNTLETSDLAEEVAADVLVGFAYARRRTQEGAELTLSFRSRPGVDVGLIASSLGGGGHRAAAGCTVHAGIAEPYDTIQRLIASTLPHDPSER